MEILSTLSPAQTLLVLKPSSTTADLMKFTLMDLLMRDELLLIDYNPGQILGSPRLGFARIGVGEKFNITEPRLHEMIFLFPYFKKPDSKIAVKHLIQMAMNTAKNESHYKEKLLMDDLEMKNLFTKKFNNKLFGGISLSSEGKSTKDKIIEYFLKLDKELPALQKNEKEKAEMILKSIKGNVLLLNSVKFEFIQAIGREINLIQEEIEGN